jgi:hypothetical protein
MPGEPSDPDPSKLGSPKSGAQQPGPQQPDPQSLWPQKLWQSQTSEYDPMTLAAIHEKARTFQATIKRRNAREYFGCVIVILGMLPAVLHRESWMMQAGGALIMLAVLFVGWQLHRRASAEKIPDMGEPLIDAYRAQLIRQRDALRSVGVWYLAPFIPGMALLLLGRWFQSHVAGRSLRTDHFAIACGAAFVVLVFLGVWLLNRRGAKRLQRRIDEL